MIGILGGMGPESTAYTYMCMVRFCQKEYGARMDSDFPPILIYSMPVPDVVEAGSDDGQVLGLLDGGIGRLRAAGAEFSLIACNSMQGFVPALREKYCMVSLVDEALRAARSSGRGRWGLLATETTLRKGYYQAAFQACGLEVVVPGVRGQDEVTKAIREILAGGDMGAPRSRLLCAMHGLGSMGAEGVVLACTDLPVALAGVPLPLPALDTAALAAEAAIRRWKGGGGPSAGPANPPF